MSDYTPTTVSSISEINGELTLIASSLSSKADTDLPNTMEGDLDMNSNDILNVGNIGVETLTLAGVPLTVTTVDIIDTTDDYTWTGNHVFQGTTLFQNAIYVGTTDTTRGVAHIYGADTTNGGELRLYTAGDSDTNINHFSLDASLENFRVYDAAGTIYLRALYASGALEATNGLLYVGRDDTDRGIIHVYSDSANTDGGYIRMHQSGLYGGTNDYWDIVPNNGNLLLKRDGTTHVTFEEDGDTLFNRAVQISRPDGTSALTLNAYQSGVYGRLNFQTNGSNRWWLGKGVTAEGGSNSGSNFAIWRFNDAGSNIDQPFVIIRDTGEVQIENNLYAKSEFRLGNAAGTTPASAAATGDAGEIRWDANYIYVCVGTNTWKRAALATW